MTGLDLDHVAIAVPSLGEAIALHESLSGLTATAPETLPVQGCGSRSWGCSSQPHLIPQWDVFSPAGDLASTTSLTARTGWSWSA